MTIRIVLATAIAALTFSAALAPAAEAAGKRRPGMHAMHGKKPMAHRAMRGHGAMRAPARTAGGDGGSAEVDRLNAQSLAQARGG